MSTTRSKPIYLDHAATTPLLPAVRKAIMPFFDSEFGNAGSLHSFGQRAVAAVDKARETIAKSVGAKFEQVVFTGSATEANNLVLRGAIKLARQSEVTAFQNQNNFVPATKFSFPSSRQLRGKSEAQLVGPAGHSSKRVTSNKPFRVIISSIEHDSVLQTAKDLEREGTEVVYLPVDSRGVVDLKALKASLNERTVLVSVMYVSNEIGTIQPIKEISKIIHEYRKAGFSSRKDGVSFAQPLIRPLASHPRSSAKGGRRAHSGSEILFLEENSAAIFPLFHTDAVQAFRYLDCDINKLGVDAMTLSAHKIGGPKGVGALCTRIKFPPLVTGGGQESGMRSGTENVAGIVGFASAVTDTIKNRARDFKKVGKLRDEFAEGLRDITGDIQWNGFDTEKAGDGLFSPHVLSVFFPAHLAEELLVKLDRVGVAVSSGSACSARASKLSYVLSAIGCTTDRIQCSIRFSFAPELSTEDIHEALQRIRSVL